MLDREYFNYAFGHLFAVDAAYFSERQRERLPTETLQIIARETGLVVFLFLPMLNLQKQQRKAQINAISMLSVLDHHIRCEEDEIAVGILLGINNTKVAVTNAFPAKVVDGEIDYELVQKMEASLQQTSGEVVVGWYCCAPNLDQNFIKTERFLSELSDEKAPICLWIDTSIPFEDSVPAKCFILSPCQVSGSEISTGFALEIPLQLQSNNDLLAVKTMKNSQDPLQQLENSLKDVKELLAILRDSTQKMAVF